jgi:hypothetical protein
MEFQELSYSNAFKGNYSLEPRLGKSMIMRKKKGSKSFSLVLWMNAMWY